VVCLRKFGSCQFVADDCPDEEIINGVRVIRIAAPTSSSPPGFRGYQVNKRLVSEIVNRISPAAVDLVNAHSPILLGRAASRLAFTTGKPLIYEYHQLDFPWKRPPSFSQGIATAVRWHRMCRILDRANAVVVQTEMQKSRVMQVFKVPAPKITVLPMGVNTNHFCPDPKLKQVGRPSMRLRLGLCGNLSKDWGVDTVLEAMAKLPQRYREQIQLKICGRGRMEQDVEAAASTSDDTIRWMGTLDYEAMPQFYDEIDYLLLHLPNCSVWQENHPTKLFEALAMGKQIVATPVPGVTAVLGKKAVYFQPNHVESLVSTIVNLVEKPLDNEPTFSRLEVERRFAWKPVREAMDTLIDQVASGQFAS